MTFKLGQRVESPLGVGEIHREGFSFNNVVSYLVRFTLPKDKNGTLHPVVEFPDYHLTPYKTAHEKLIDMGFTKFYELGNSVKYSNGQIIIRFDKDDNTVLIYNKFNNNSPVINMELSCVLTQYMEELKQTYVIKEGD